MSIHDLLDVMDSEGIVIDLVGKLRRIDMRTQFGLENDECLGFEEQRVLAEAAVLLAISTNERYRQLSLYVTNTLPTHTDSVGVKDLCLVAAGRLSNFPSIPLIAESHNYAESMSGLSLFEMYVQEAINTVEFGNGEIILTDFQKRVVDMIRINRAVSFSAPTSAGKSFVLERILMEIATGAVGTTVIYVVPTRALIHQIIGDIVDLLDLSVAQTVNVSASAELRPLLNNSTGRNILVLTQERLHQLCNSEGARQLRVSLIIVDEAQEIQAGQRGVILEEAVSAAIRMWPDMKVVFASPLIRNPEKLLSLFELPISAHELNNFSLVSQNVFKVIRNRGALEVFDITSDEESLLGTVEYRALGNAFYKVMGGVVLSLWNGEVSIVYANEPMLAAQIARVLYNSGQFPRLYDQELEEFASFIEEHVHEHYELANFVRSGLAFHFGKLPPSIRSGIEDLLSDGLLKVVCSTSTLLEGLNMPAKNIFIYKPTRGRGSALTNHEFWNLAGRAGRMGKDLAGNIVCIEINDWEHNPLNRELQILEPASEVRLLKETNNFISYICDDDKKSARDEFNEQVLSRTIKRRIQQGETLAESRLSNESNRPQLEIIDKEVQKIIMDFTGPQKILEINPGILPNKIDALWGFFCNSRDEWRHLMPRYPLEGGFFQNFTFIVSTINRFVLDDLFSAQYIKKLVTVSRRWVTGAPLSELLTYGLGRETSPERITSHVLRNMEFLENNIRYTLVKYTSLYVELLRLFLAEIGLEAEAESVTAIMTYLEFGACTASALNFMSSGLSRAAAIALGDIIGNPQTNTVDDCIRWLHNQDVSTLNIPSYLRREIRRFQGVQ